MFTRLMTCIFICYMLNWWSFFFFFYLVHFQFLTDTLAINNILTELITFELYMEILVYITALLSLLNFQPFEPHKVIDDIYFIHTMFVIYQLQFPTNYYFYFFYQIWLFLRFVYPCSYRKSLHVHCMVLPIHSHASFY